MNKEKDMRELTSLLNAVPDSYFDFVLAIINYAKKKETRMMNVLDYLHTHPSAMSSDVVQFVAGQSDFYEDAAYMKVG